MSMAQLEYLTSMAEKANMQGITGLLADCVRLLRKENIVLSDRRIVKSQRLIAAAAVLDGRESPNEADLWPILHVIARQEDQLSAREILKEQLSGTQNLTLGAAAENASMGPLARAQRLVEQAEVLLAVPPDERNMLSLEALGREIDTGFNINTMPESLKLVREQLMDVLGLVE